MTLFTLVPSYNADFWHFSLSGCRRHAARNSRAYPLVRSSPPQTMSEWVCGTSPLQHHKQKARSMRSVGPNHRF